MIKSNIWSLPSKNNFKALKYRSVELKKKKKSPYYQHLCVFRLKFNLFRLLYGLNHWLTILRIISKSWVIGVQHWRKNKNLGLRKNNVNNKKNILKYPMHFGTTLYLIQISKCFQNYFKGRDKRISFIHALVMCTCNC